MKKYCCKCDNFREMHCEYGSSYWCILDIYYEETPRCIIKKVPQNTEVRNADNDCADFKKLTIKTRIAKLFTI